MLISDFCFQSLKQAKGDHLISNRLIVFVHLAECRCSDRKEFVEERLNHCPLCTYFVNGPISRRPSGRR